MIVTIIFPRITKPPYCAQGIEVYLDGVKQERLYSVSGVLQDGNFEWSIIEKKENCERWRTDIECDARIIIVNEGGIDHKELMLNKPYKYIPIADAPKLKEAY